MHQTREYILNRLSGCDEPLSGDLLAKELGLSRAGIWKHIQILKQHGADIEARPGKGYRLGTPVLTASLLQARLQQASEPYVSKRNVSGYALSNHPLAGKPASRSPLVIGKQVLLVDETGSTNADVMKLAEQGEAEGLVLIAGRQTGGRGRLGRLWHTVAESLAVSVLLRPPLPPERVSQLSLVVAVALHEALQRYAPELRIKWPNDLMYKGAKLAGILIEMRAEPGRVQAVVPGFGINLQAPTDGWPVDITQQVTDLATAAGGTVAKLDVLVSILLALDSWYARYLAEGFEPVRTAWWQAHAASDQQVRVHDGRSYIYGIARALEADGALLLETEQGMQRIIAGDLELL